MIKVRSLPSKLELLRDRDRNRILTVIAVFLACILLLSTPRSVAAFSNGQIASRVLGQSSFSTDNTGLSQTMFNGPSGIAFDSSGNLWIADYFNNRVLEFSPPFTNGESASLVLGSDSFTVTTKNGFVNQSSLENPHGLAFDSSGNLWVADTGNNRVVEFEKGAGFFNGELESVVLGQSSFSTRSSEPLSASTFFSPDGLAFDSAGNLWVADTGNNRVVEFIKGAGGFTDDQSASLVLGQSVFTTNAPSLSATGLNDPFSIAFDSSGNLWVVDGGNDRVVEFPDSFSSGESATTVIGAIDLTSKIDAATQNGLVLPAGLAFDPSGNLWVADYDNNRVLEFPTPLATAEDASLVLGQSSFTSSAPGLGPASLSNPTSLAVDSSGNLWVSDASNQRVLQFINNPYNCAEILCGFLQLPDGECPPICTIPQGQGYELSLGLSPNSPSVSFFDMAVTPPAADGNIPVDPATLTCTGTPLVCGPVSINLPTPGSWTFSFTPTYQSGATGSPLDFSVQVTPSIPTPVFPIGTIVAVLAPLAALGLYVWRLKLSPRKKIA